MKNSLLVALCAGSLAAWSVPAWADDLFTITVPMNLTNLSPDVKVIRVGCHLSEPAPSTGKNINVGPEMGKFLDLAPTNGSYTAPVIIVFKTEDFTSQEIANLSLVNHVSCNLGIQGPDKVWYSPSGQTTPLLGNKPGAPFSPIVNAAVPK